METTTLRLVPTEPVRQDQRAAIRYTVAVPGQIVWKDARGTTRMASVMTKDVSTLGVSVECVQGPAIPLYRMVYFQLDRSVRNRSDLPPALSKANVLSAVFRVGPCSARTGAPVEYALRLLTEPGRVAPPAVVPTWSAQAAARTA